MQKIPGNYDPNKQRTIHLLEADFSEGCKIIFSKRMMENARIHQFIPEEQYARRGGKAIDGAMHKVLILDHFRIMRVGGVCMSSDLMNCYDRMVHSVGSLSMQTMGVPTQAIQCLSSTVQRMRNFVRTAYGDSDHYYGEDENDLLQGGGQGNPAAPPMWTAISIILLRILASCDPGVIMTASISLIVTLVTAIMYVNDTDLFVRRREDEGVDSLQLRTQNIIDKWTGALWATGGVLRPEKCWWMLVEFKWQGSKWKYVDKDDVEMQIVVPNHMQIQTEVEQIGPDIPKTTLGVVISGDGSMQGQKEKLIKKSMEWAENMGKAYLYKSEANLALNTTLARTWAYPLQATSLTLEECEEIMKPAYKVILAKLGSNRHIPRVYRYAPKGMNGLGLPHVYTMQGCAKLKSFLTHMRRGTKIGNSLETMLEASNIELGTDVCIFSLKYDRWEKLLTRSWIKSLWEFVDRYNINLKGSYDKPKMSRKGDIFLMDSIIHNRGDLFDWEDLGVINRCRLYLQVLTLGDIATSDGQGIAFQSRVGQVDEHRTSKYKWPIQLRPTSKEWKVWEKAIRYIWEPALYIDGDKQRLGEWEEERHQKFKFL